MDSNIQNLLMELLYMVIISGVPTIILILKRYFDAKIDQIQGNSEILSNQKLSEYVDAAQDIVETIVTAVSQTYVDTLKANGKFTQEAQIQAKNQAMDKAKVLINETLKQSVSALYGDFDTWLDTVIEKFVKEGKQK